MKHPELDTIPGMKQEREGAGKSYSCGSWQPTHQELQPVALVGKPQPWPKPQTAECVKCPDFLSCYSQTYC